jgi:hypothetical protein
MAVQSPSRRVPNCARLKGSEGVPASPKPEKRRRVENLLTFGEFPVERATAQIFFSRDLERITATTLLRVAFVLRLSCFVSGGT